MWKPGDHLAHRFNRQLGPGIVRAVDSRSVTVEFPQAGETLRLTRTDTALVPLAEAALPTTELPLARLAKGEVDSLDDFSNRLDGLRLSRLRQARGLGSFLGGRIRLFPHQLYTAERACRTLPVRWLLADEVGLGKTVEACLIMNRLLHTGQAERTLVLAPDTLVLQWLGELWRKHHHVFAMLDEKRLDDVAKDLGEGFNPFDIHRRAILSFETLVARPQLARQAVATGIDLLVVDEAHHLRRPPGHPGEPLYRLASDCAAVARHALFLTATPLEDDAFGFLRLLQLLRPAELPDEASLKACLERRIPLPNATSATRRQDIGGLPPRQARPVDPKPESEAGWQALARLEDHLRREPATDPLARRRKLERVARALASPAALVPRLDRADETTRQLCDEASRLDPRPAWLVAQAEGWRKAGEKTLVFVAEKLTLDAVKAELERRSPARVGLFHEELSPERRDIEVAQFRLKEGPALLISTECGGEGRNFEFCHRLVLFDLPWNPSVVEQRIGRLDRIGRVAPTEIVYFRPPGGLGRAAVEALEELGLFERPLGGLDREARRVREALEAAALGPSSRNDTAIVRAAVAEARQLHQEAHDEAWHELYQEPYTAALAPGILARVPPNLEALTQEVVLKAAASFGFLVEPQSGRGTWLIEYGYEAITEHLQGVPPGSRFLGTFDRQEAVDKETLDFFASGHPLVEGILTEIEEGERGRAALFTAPGPEETFGLLVIYRRGVELEAVVIDAQGRSRPDLAAFLAGGKVEPRRVESRKWTSQAAWGNTVRKLAAALPSDAEPQAVAAFRLSLR